MVARHVLPLGQASHWLVSLQCLASFALICVLNTWWFAKMARGLWRLLMEAKGKGKSDGSDGVYVRRKAGSNNKAA